MVQSQEPQRQGIILRETPADRTPTAEVPSSVLSTRDGEFPATPTLEQRQ